MDPRKGTIIITGSSGMIGSPLSAMLGAAYNAVGFDRAGPPYPPIEVECVSVDLTADDRIRRALARVRFAYGPRLASVIHLAAYYDFSGEPSPLYEEITVRGTERLLRALHEMQFEVEQFVFSSTMLVHAPGRPGERICEDSPIEPRWDYPRSKAETEKVIKAERGAIPSVMLRIAGVYDDDCHSIPLAHQIQRIYERRLTGRVYPGDVSRGQAFVHLDDTLEAIRRAVEKRQRVAAGHDAADRGAGDAQLRRIAARIRQADPRRRVGHAPDPQGDREDGRLDAGQHAAGRGAVHQAVDGGSG